MQSNNMQQFQQGRNFRMVQQQPNNPAHMQQGRMQQPGNSMIQQPGNSMMPQGANFRGSMAGAMPPNMVGPGQQQMNMGLHQPQVNMGPGPQQMNMGPGQQQMSMGPGQQQMNMGTGLHQMNIGPAPQQMNMGAGPQQMNMAPGQQQMNMGTGMSRYANNQGVSGNMQYMNQIPGGGMPARIAPGSVGPGGMRPGYPNVQPPGYTPEMAKQFQAKQEARSTKNVKSAEEQRKLYEQSLKKQAFQEQQKKLKEFNNMSGRKINADAMIQHIVGPTITAAPKPVPIPAKQSEDGDGFGDFMQGPSAPPTQHMPTNQDTTESQSTSASTNQKIPQATPSQSETVSVKEKPKDLTSMMFECSDFNAPAKAKSFVKKSSIKDIQVQAKKTTTYNVSQKSRNWGATDGLSDIFVLPEQPKPPEDDLLAMGNVPAPNVQPAQPGIIPSNMQTHIPPGSTVTPPVPASAASQVGIPPDPIQVTTPPQVDLPAGALPPWCEAGFSGTMPPVYSQVQEACMKEGKLDTELVYGIFLRSGLLRPMLGTIWTLSNKTTPGVLEQHELYIALALIALVQNQIPFDSLVILKRCIQPPIPYLGQPTQTQNHPGETTQPGATPQIKETVPSENVQPTGTNQSASGADDDFADFQSGPTNITPPTLPPSGVGPSNGHVPTSTPQTPQMSTQSTPQIPLSTSFGEFAKASTPSSEEQHSKYDVFKSPQNTDSVDKDDEFADFQQASTDSFSTVGGPQIKTLPTPGVSGLPAPSQPSGGNKLADLHALIQNAELYKTPVKSDEPTEQIASDLGTLDVSATTAPPGVQVEEEWSGFTASNTTNEKFEAFAQNTAGTTGFVESPEVPNDDDWFANIKHSAPITPVSEKHTPTNEEPSSIPSANQHSAINVPETVANGSVSVPKIITNISTVPNIPTNEHPPKPESKTAEVKSKNNPKANSMFGRNLDTWSGTSAPLTGTGMSPLDMLPPDLPDDEPPEDDYYTGSTAQSGQSFDHFGTFQEYGSVADNYRDDDFDLPGEASVGGSATLGGTQAGCLDTLGYASRPTTLDTAEVTTQDAEKLSIQSGGNTSTHTDTVSLGSGSEFSGWKSQVPTGLDTGGTIAATPDVQSVSSLDLYANKKDDTSPQDSTQDCKSINSLELSSVTPGQNSTPEPEEKQSIGTHEAPSTDMAPTNGDQFCSGPIDASHLYGGTVAPQFGDRYSGIKDTQDSDSHLNDWSRCIAQCNDMIEVAYQSFNSVDSKVCEEVLSTQKAQDYMHNVNEVYKVAKRITVAMKANSLSNNNLLNSIEQIDTTWQKLQGLITNNSLRLTPDSLDFSSSILKQADSESSNKACGVCLLNVEPLNNGTQKNGTHKLSHGGRQYHAPCANLWVNKVNSILPALKIPELL